MSALICGSFAYDTIMLFQGHFKNEIMPDKVHMLNVSFLVPDMRKEFGGCAGNIAYNLKLLGGDGKPMGTVGRDFDDYAKWMDSHGVSRDYVKSIDDAYTAQAYITTDLDDNQITAFHPGAMSNAHEQTVPTSGLTLGIISPDGRDGMLQHAEQFAEQGIPFIFDPGQGMPMFDGDDIKRFLELATYVTVNDYESEMLRSKAGLSIEEAVNSVDTYIVTRGARGSRIHTDGKVLEIPSARPKALADPTGCGDAYRAGLIYGLQNNKDWETTGRIASLMGALKIEKPGTQNHSFTFDEFAERFKSEFNVALG